MIEKRLICTLTALLAVLALSTATAQATPFVDVGSQPPITLLINSSPWFDGFEGVVRLYEEQTGNRVNLDINPYPAMLEKIRNAVRDRESPFDWFSIDVPWTVELYSGDFLTPIHEIDPEFALDAGVIDYGESIYWNAEVNWRQREGGTLMTLPINGNLVTFYYRADLYEAAGLPHPPRTWEDVLGSCDQVASSPDVVCFVVRSVGGNNFFIPHLPMFGASIIRDPAAGDFTVTINSLRAKEALDLVVALAREHGPANQGAINQSDMIQLMATGRVVQMLNVVAAWPDFDNPTRSAVVGLVEAAVPPRPADGVYATDFVNWVAGIPRNIPDERKEAALAFMRWFLDYEAQLQYAELGAVPIHLDVYGSDLADESPFRWMEPYAETIAYGGHQMGFAEASQVSDIINIRLSQAIIGELSTAQALNLMAQDIHRVFQDAGRSTGLLEPLPEN